MINALILYDEAPKRINLENEISKHCSRLSISSTYCNEDILPIILSIQPQLVFLELEKNPISYAHIFEICQNRNFETILISSNRDFIFEASKYKISGYLLKPINSRTLINTVDYAIKRINRYGKNQNKVQNKSTSVIGIPTMEGYEILPIQDIVRCESYLKCTRVIIDRRPDVISSYNIGEFTKTLSGFNFYKPHQSHLINISKIKKYLKEGTIIMVDDSVVPVSRRNRTDLMNHVLHI